MPLDEIKSLEKVFERRAIEALDSGIAFEQGRGQELLWLLSKLNPALAAEKKKGLVKDEQSLVKVILYCITHGKYSSGSGDSGRTFRVDKEELSSIIEINRAYNMIRSYIKTQKYAELSEDDQLDLSAFLLSVEHPEAADRDDLHYYENKVRDRWKMIPQIERN